MSYRDSVPIKAAADLSSYKYRAVTVGGTLAASGAACIGILQNAAGNGQDATAAYQGRSKYVAGAAVTAGARLGVQSGGWLVTVASGDATQMVGTALGTVSSGETGEAIINFAVANNY
jgi:hypothetical protein